MTQSDLHLENARLQKEISEYIGLPSSSILFEYSELDQKIKLDIITVNAVHRQSFLFHSVVAVDKIDALNKMFEYVKNYRDKESSFTIQWSLKGENELNTSYFRASNIITALDKLFYGRDQSSIIVFSAVLNPIS
jgi:hypothetical protein